MERSEVTKCNFLLRGGQVKIDDSGLPLPTKNEKKKCQIFSSLVSSLKNHEASLSKNFNILKIAKF